MKIRIMHEHHVMHWQTENQVCMLIKELTITNASEVTTCIKISPRQYLSEQKKWRIVGMIEGGRQYSMLP